MAKTTLTVENTLDDGEDWVDIEDVNGLEQWKVVDAKDKNEWILSEGHILEPTLTSSLWNSASSLLGWGSPTLYPNPTPLPNSYSGGEEDEELEQTAIASRLY